MDVTNPEKRAQLLQQGYCVFEQVLDEEFLNRIREVSERLLEKQTEEDIRANLTKGSNIPVLDDPFFVELITWPKALGALHAMGFGQPKFASGFIISKPSKSPELFWHYDYGFWKDPNCFAEIPQQLFLMYYLVDTSPHNGCLRVIPGSHLHDNPLHQALEEAHSDDLLQYRNPDSFSFSSRSDEVDVPVRAGDLVIGDSRLLHASHANKSDQRRTVITFWYFPDVEILSEPVLAHIAEGAAHAERIIAEQSWPESAVRRLEPLWTRYEGEAAAIQWDRRRPNRGQ